MRKTMPPTPPRTAMGKTVDDVEPRLKPEFKKTRPRAKREPNRPPRKET